MAQNISGILRAAAALPWAIIPEKLQAIIELLELRANGGAFSGEEIAARLGERRSGSDIRTVGSIALMPLFGVISQRMNMMAEISGGTSTEKFAAAFDQAVRDDAVSAIVIEIDSPGGSVAGVPELTQRIREARGTKPIIAVANTLMASAAYWLGSAADEIVVAPSAEIGSIGVFSMHVDQSGMDEKMGLARTIIRAGRFKAEGNPFEPLSKEAREDVQQKVDTYYDMFVTDVAKNRGVTPATVRSSYGEGRVVTAQQAVALGMADRVATIEDVVSQLSGGRRVTRRASAEVPHEAPQAASAITGDSPEGVEAPIALGSSTPAPEARSITVIESPTVATTNGAAPTPNASAGEERSLRLAELAAAHGRTADLPRWISDGRSVESIRSEVLDSYRATQPAVAAPAPQNPLAGIPAREARRFSLSAALRAATSRDWRNAGYEAEVSQELGRVLGRSTEGFLAPMYGTPQATTHTTTGATTGQDLVFVEPGSFIDILRNTALVVKMGAEVMAGLVGNIAMPRQTGAGTAYWRAENPGADVTESNQTFDQEPLSPKNLMATQSYSRQLLSQTRYDIGGKVNRDLGAITGLAVDKAALHGTGADDQPTGIYARTGVNPVAFGGPITYAKLIEMIVACAAENAILGSMGFLTAPEIAGDALTTQKFAGTNGEAIWTGRVDEGLVAGYVARATNQIAKDLGVGNDELGLIFGHWFSCKLGEWGAIEYIVNPYSKAKQGLVEVTSYALVDVGFDHPEAFSKATGLVLA